MGEVSNFFKFRIIVGKESTDFRKFTLDSKWSKGVCELMYVSPSGHVYRNVPSHSNNN